MKQKCFDLFGCRKKKVGWIRHVLTLLSSIIFITGAFLLVYISWVLATSFHVTHFLTGTLVFTYSVIGLGLLLFLTGLIGWVASTSEKVCTLKLYLTVLVITACSQIGGIVALNVFGTEMNEILKFGWYEVNQATRSLVQAKMDCCGFEGAHEFSDQSIVIAESCYFPTTGNYDIADKHLKPDGCGAFLRGWFEKNKIVWCSILALLGGLQLMCIVLCAHIIHKLKDKSLSSPSSSTKNLSSSQFI